VAKTECPHGAYNPRDFRCKTEGCGYDLLPRVLEKRGIKPPQLSAESIKEIRRQHPEVSTAMLASVNRMMAYYAMEQEDWRADYKLKYTPINKSSERLLGKLSALVDEIRPGRGPIYGAGMNAGSTGTK
jgi:hypothetical protein